jgi:hypothetical protein
VKARNHSRVASALLHSEGIAYKPPCTRESCPMQLFYLPVCWVLTLIFNAISIRRRIASGRPGRSGCFNAQASTFRSNSG